MIAEEIYRTLRDAFVLLEFGNYDALQPLQLENIEYRALQILETETGLRMIDLRERLLCDKSKVTRIIDNFENRGLAQRLPDPEDRRAWKVFLTTEGLQLQEQAQIAFTEAINSRFSIFDLSEQEQLLAMLESLRSQLLYPKKQG